MTNLQQLISQNQGVRCDCQGVEEGGNGELLIAEHKVSVSKINVIWRPAVQHYTIVSKTVLSTETTFVSYVRCSYHNNVNNV
jgi:hypothetical protein